MGNQPTETLHRRAAIHDTLSRGDALADAVTAGMGSWQFIIGQSVIVAVWILLNVAAVALRWDPYPFILLNLLFSTQAAYASPLILMSNNRAARKDHVRDDLEAKEVDELFVINRQQYEILELLRQVAATQHTAQAFGWHMTLARTPRSLPEPVDSKKGE